MPASLTDQERRVYHYLIDFLAEHTYQPSVREIARRFRIRSTRTVADILQSLALKGYVERQGGRSRGLRLLGFPAVGNAQPVPLYRRLETPSMENGVSEPERYLAMDRTVVPADDAFLVQVADDGLSDRGIRAGDLVLVDPAARARDGDAVVARVGGETLVRLVVHRGAEVALHPGRANGTDLVLGPDDDYAIVGTVAGVVRERETEDRERATEAR